MSDISVRTGMVIAKYRIFWKKLKMQKKVLVNLAQCQALNYCVNKCHDIVINTSENYTAKIHYCPLSSVTLLSFFKTIQTNVHIKKE